MLEVLNKEKFSLIVEKIVIEKRILYMDAICWGCEEDEMEIEIASKLISPLIKAKIEVEAQALNFLPKCAKLPI